MTDLPALARLLSSATPLPWRVDHETHRGTDDSRVMGIDGPERTEDYGSGPEVTRERIVETDCGHYGPSKPDADLIVAAINSLPSLLRIAQAAEAWVEAQDGDYESSFQRRMAGGDAELELRRAVDALKETT